MEAFPWQKGYPAGVAKEIELYEFNSMIDFFDHCLHEYADRVAFENMGATITYRELDKLSTDFAAYLQSLGLEKGDRIAIQMPNLLQFPVTFIGAIKAGLIVVNTNPLYTAPEMEHQFKDSGAKAIVIVANFACNLEKIIKKTGIEHVIVTKLGDLIPGIKGNLINFVVKYIKKMVPDFNLPGAVAFNHALASGKKLHYQRPQVSIEDTAVLQYTGGTTGVSKGATLSHGNLVAHNSIIAQWFTPYLDDQQAVMVTAIPMYHIFALTVNGLLMMHKGAKILLITNPRDMNGFIKTLSKSNFTIITGVNTLFNGMLNHPKFAQLNFRHLKGTIAGGMALQDAVADRWEKVTGTPMVQGYGLSETSPVLCCNPLDGTHRKGSIGIPVPSTEVAIFDDHGNQLPQGEIGEICGRGPQVMSGYWEKDNADVFYPGGWFKTGDIGCMDEDGFFKIVDRKKDMIKVSGFNVFPNEIENIIAGNEKVSEVAAIGIPDEKSGEVIKIFVVKKDASLSEEELRNFCSENMTKYKVPRHIVFRDELPKTNVGKILRRALKEEEGTA